MLPKRIAHYEITAKLGEGGMGVVYRATDSRLQRDVALKVLPSTASSDPEARAQLTREARNVSALNHPNICHIYEVNEWEGVTYFAMEFVEGELLSAKISAGGLTTEAAVRFGTQIASALDHAHSRGIVHRDLKSANVMITREGVVKVLDFGLAQRITQEELEATRSLAARPESIRIQGTLPYMAPEQLRGEPPDVRSDIWALGIVLFEMAAGARPFQARTGFELSSAILREPLPELPAHVSPGFRAAIQRCLVKEPAQRFQRAGEVRAALETILADAQPRAAKPARPRRSKALLVGIVAMLSVLGALALLNRAAISALFTKTSTPRIQSLAVLPLANLSGDSSQDYFAEAMTEELTAEMAALSSLRVISRTSASQYRNSKKPLREMAEEMGVDALIEGSVLRAADRVRITVQLIDGPSDRHLWSKSYERAATDLMGLQREVAKAVAQEIQLTLTPQEQLHLAELPTRNAQAYEAYLRANYRLQYIFRSPEDADAAIQFAEQAIALDPNFAEAYVAAARGCQTKIFAWNGGTEYDEKAVVMIGKALAINPNLADAYQVRGALYYTQHYKFDLPRAIADYRTAIRLNPNLAAAHHSLGSELTHLGLHEKAAEEFRTAIRLDPANNGAKMRLARTLWQSQRFTEALDQYRRDNIRNGEAAVTLAYLGKLAEAREALEEFAAQRLYPATGLVSLNEDVLATRAFLNALQRKAAEAERDAQQSIKLGAGKPHFHHAAFLLAAAYAELGRPRSAVEMLRSAADSGMPNYPLFRENPSMKKLHGTPEYERFMAELKARWDRVLQEIQ